MSGTVLSNRVRGIVAVLGTIVMVLAGGIIPMGLARDAQASDSLGGFCTSQDITIGSGSSSGVNDTGVATYVGRDLYIGSRPGNPLVLDDANKPGASYTVELEGLTVVNGKMAIHQVNNSWHGWGVRLGAVGFGSHFRPETGSVALAVGGGSNSLINTMNGSGTASIAGWVHGAWLGGADGTDNIWYRALMSGGNTKIAGTNRNVLDTNGGSNANNGNHITWGMTDALGDVNGVDYTDYASRVASDSDVLVDTIGFNTTHERGYDASNDASSPGVYVGTGRNETITRTKYVNDNTPSISITFHDGYNERLITFNGDGTSPMQVFTVDAKYFNLDENDMKQSGLSFAFENIPDGASVAVNVVNAPSTGIRFHNGWRYYWNGRDIANGYSESTPMSEYNTAAKSVLWNFADARSLTIMGGRASVYYDYNGTRTEHHTDDDPAAATIGSIWVPRGSFDNHVTTNGRVYVGEDLMMNSPTVAISNATGSTASTIWMDQERHNYPWNGMLRNDCATIQWSKVKRDGDKYVLMGGTKFGVFTTREAALNYDPANPRVNAPLIEVIDNDYITGDRNTTEGVFTIGNLKPNADYYIREIATNDTGYEKNPYVYLITAGKAGETTILGTGDTAWAYGPGNPDATLNAPQTGTTGDGVLGILNERKSAPVQWGKAADTGEQGLPGSAWEITRKGDPDETWTVRDNTTAIATMRIQRDSMDITGKTITVESGDVFTLQPVLTPANTDITITWESSDPQAVTVENRNGTQNATVTVNHETSDGKPVTITAITKDGTTASTMLSIQPSTVPTVDIVNTDGTVITGTTVHMHTGEQYTFGYKTEATGSPKWSSSNTSVATIDASTGKLTAISVGETTVKATIGGGEASVTVSVEKNGTVISIHWADAPGVNIKYGYDDNGKNHWTDNNAMTQGPCDGWWTYTVPLTGKRFEAYISDTRGHTYEPSTSEPSKSGNNFIINGTSTQYNISDGRLNTGAPACAASTVNNANTERTERTVDTVHMATVADTVDTVDSASLVDMDTRVGMFMVDGLQDGEYTLVETVAPDGYLLNPTVYGFSIVNGVFHGWYADGEPFETDYLWVEDALIPENPSEGSVSWDKVDAGYSGDTDDGPLGGSSWTLEHWNGSEFTTVIGTITDCMADGCTGTRDTDSAAGSFQVDGLGMGNYRLRETKAPDGYAIGDGYYYFTLDDGTMPVLRMGTADDHDDRGAYTGTSASIVDNRVPNTRITGTVEWVKTDSTGENGLTGSEWSLTYTDNDGTTATCSITDDGITGTGNGDAPCGITADNASIQHGRPDGTKPRGMFIITGLPWGDYTLVETKAPNGFVIDRTEHRFSITPTTPSMSVDLGSIKNVPTVGMPSTDGQHNYAIIMLIIMGIIAGMLILVRLVGTRHTR